MAAPSGLTFIIYTSFYARINRMSFDAPLLIADWLNAPLYIRRDTPYYYFYCNGRRSGVVVEVVKTTSLFAFTFLHYLSILICNIIIVYVIMVEIAET